MLNLASMFRLLLVAIAIAVIAPSQSSADLSVRKGDLSRFVDKPTGEVLKKVSWINDALNDLLGDDRVFFADHFESVIPTRIENGFFVLQAHGSGEGSEALVAISLQSREVHCSVTVQEADSWSLRIFSEDKADLPIQILLSDSLKLPREDLSARSGGGAQATSIREAVALDLQPTLQNGPDSVTLEALLRNLITNDPSWFPFRQSLGETKEKFEATRRGILYGYQAKIITNVVKSAEIKNQYSRIVQGETIYHYEISVTVGFKFLQPTPENRALKVERSILVGVVSRGTKWYMTPAGKIDESER